MSYEIIKGISIKNNEVYLNSASNNVYPRYFKKWHCTSLTEILQKQGRDALDLELLKQYEEGMFQPGVPNKYSLAIDNLRRKPEYEKFNWRNRTYKEVDPVGDARRTEEFNKLLMQCISEKPNKTVYLASKINWGGNEIYILRVTTKVVKWTDDKTKAKKFKFVDEIENLNSHCNTTEVWKAIPVL